MTDIVEHLRDIGGTGFPNWADDAADEIERLRAALRVMIYETTHLSPEEDDGSHWCKISKSALSTARAALTQEGK